MSGKPLMKAGELLSPTYSDWVRSQPCSVCGRPPRSEQHHHPGRGERGATHDVRSMPVCRWCHMRCEGQTVLDERFNDREPMPPISEVDQRKRVAQTFLSFIETAPWQAVEHVLRDIKRWRDSRVWVEA